MKIVTWDPVHVWRISSKMGSYSSMLAVKFSCPLKQETSRKLKNSNEPIGNFELFMLGINNIW